MQERPCPSKPSLGCGVSARLSVQVVLSNSVISQELGSLGSHSIGMHPSHSLADSAGIDGVPAGFLVTAVQQVVAFFVSRAR